MKRITVLIIGLLMAALLAPSAAAQYGQTGKKPSRARRFFGLMQATTGLQFELPAVRNVTGINIGGNFGGASIEGTRVELVNAAPMDGTLELYAGVTRIATLGPGDSAVDHRRMNLLDAEAPVAGFYFNARRELLGVVTTRLHFSSINTQPQVVTFGDRGIRRAPNGEFFTYQWSYNAPQYPLPETRMERKKVKFPREWFDGANGIQVVNMSGFEVTISSAYNGEVLSLARDQLLGQITERYRGWFASTTNYIRVTWWQEVGDRRLLVRVSDPIAVSAPSQGVWAEQLIVWASGIERR